MGVTIAEGVTVTDGQHAALHALDLQPENGQVSDRAQQMIDIWAGWAEEDAAATEAELAAEEESGHPDEGPNANWTVAQLDNYAAEHDIPDYPATGNKADKLAAIEAA